MRILDRPIINIKDIIYKLEKKEQYTPNILSDV